jgi:NAD(P)-dependent dehydrogenase (short-subunit alcohol dehydrogenase family)
MNEGDVCVVVGVGPGNGESFCRTFAEEGYEVAALARREDALRELVGDIEGVTPYRQDATDPDEVESTYETIREELGEPDVVLYNAGAGAFGTFDEVDADDMRRAWEVNALGLFHTAKAVLPEMRERGSGVLGVTGATATNRGKPFTTAFAQAKAAQHHLAESLAREFGPHGVHVFYFVVDGVIDLPRTREAMPDKDDDFFLQPDDIAHSVYEVAHQPKSAWTFEFDLRPYGEEW